MSDMSAGSASSVATFASCLLISSRSVRRISNRGHPDGRHWRSQLMRNVGDELPLRLGKLLQFPQLLLQAGRHVVEGRSERSEVVLAADRHPFLKPTGRQALRGPRRMPDRHHDPPGDKRGDRGEQHDERDPHPD
jgi:hypothetical protein